MRNVTKQAEAGKQIVVKAMYYDLQVAELQQLIDQAKGKVDVEVLYNIACQAFYFGVNAGYKIASK